MTRYIPAVPPLRAKVTLSLIALSFGGCASTEIAKTHYDDVFDPPRTWLSMRIGKVAETDISPSLVKKGDVFLRNLGDESVFEVAVRNESCRSICYFYRPVLSDHIYWVLTTDESQRTFDKYFSYSLPEHGNP